MLSSRLLLAFWLLGATVVVNSYSGTIISYLMLPKMKPSINSLEDLAQNQDVGLVVRDDMLISQIILVNCLKVNKLIV